MAKNLEIIKHRSLCNKTGKVLGKRHADFPESRDLFEPSQSVNRPKQTAWVIVRGSGIVETVGCLRFAALGKSCSHAAAILWKVLEWLAIVFTTIKAEMQLQKIYI